jgi:hypothetical protein
MKSCILMVYKLRPIPLLLSSAVIFLAACSPLPAPPLPSPTPPAASAVPNLPPFTETLPGSPSPLSASQTATATAAPYRTPPTSIPQYPPHTPGATYAPLRHWSDTLKFTPYPFTTPLPPVEYTPIDGVYALHDPAEPQWWNCRRCPDYLPAGGDWRLQFDRGVMHFFYEVTGFASVASYTVQGDQLYLFNDPHCLYDVGVYTWRLEAGALTLEEVQDACAIHQRAVNLTRQPWLSCQPRNLEAAVSDHWIKPPGCEWSG